MNIITTLTLWLQSNLFYFRNRKNIPNLTNIKKIYGYSDAQIKIITIIIDEQKFKIDGQLLEFINSNYELPCPNFIKNSVLLRNGIEGATWIETGTFLGDTTDILSKSSKMVYSIEPSSELVDKAKIRFANKENIKIIKGLSEEELPLLLQSPQLDKADLNFWLDGHFSAGITYKGPIETPIIEELIAIEKNMSRFNGIAVFIDDIRGFQPNSEYPELGYLVDWANRNNLIWHIEYDIFVAKKTTHKN